MGRPPVPMRSIGLQVSQRVADRLQAMAKAAGMPMLTFTGLLFDAAYAAKVKETLDADLDAQVSLVGLAVLSDADLEKVASASGLSIEVVIRMRDGWKTVLLERRRAG